MLPRAKIRAASAVPPGWHWNTLVAFKLTLPTVFPKRRLAPIIATAEPVNNNVPLVLWCNVMQPPLNLLRFVVEELPCRLTDTLLVHSLRYLNSSAYNSRTWKRLSGVHVSTRTETHVSTTLAYWKMLIFPFKSAHILLHEITKKVL